MRFLKYVLLFFSPLYGEGITTGNTALQVAAPQPPAVTSLPNIAPSTVPSISLPKTPQSSGFTPLGAVSSPSEISPLKGNILPSNPKLLDAAAIKNTEVLKPMNGIKPTETKETDLPKDSPLIYSKPSVSSELKSCAVYLNGVDIGSVRNQEMINVKVHIDNLGHIHLFADHYDVKLQDSFSPLLPPEYPRFPKSDFAPK